MELSEISKKCSIIIPVRGEGAAINSCLEHLCSIRSVENTEIIVVDCEDKKNTLEFIKFSGIKKIVSSPGRAPQMNAGASAATGDILVFLHSDTFLPADALHKIENTLETEACGAFKLKFNTDNAFMAFVAFTANLRVFFTGIPSGDQAIFVKKEVFYETGAYPETELMEDVEFIKKIKKLYGRPAIVNAYAVSSARKYKQDGIFKTCFRNNLIRILHMTGVDSKKLATLYYGSRI